MPSFSPISQCGLGSKSNFVGSLQVRITGLQVSSLPTGTSAAGMLGIVSRICLTLSSISFSSLSSSEILSPRARTAAICSVASCPAFFSLPISWEAVLRSFLSASTCWVISRRFLSSSRNSVKSRLPLRFFTASTTSSGFSRTNFKSNIIKPPNKIYHKLYFSTKRAQKKDFIASFNSLRPHHGAQDNELPKVRPFVPVLLHGSPATAVLCSHHRQKHLLY